MERFHREQPKAEDVMFLPVVEQNGTEYRGNEGGFVEPEHLPVDTMEGLMVSKDIPEGFYAEPVVVETPVEDNDEPTVEPDENEGLPEEE
jgi:hypothetical protein